MSSKPGLILDATCPLEPWHPLNARLVDEWAVTNLPGWRGGQTLRSLVRGMKNPHDGVLTNMAMPSTGASGWQGPHGLAGAFGALAFDGADDYVRVPDAAPLNVPRPLSISLALRFTTTSNLVVLEKNGNLGFSVQVGALAAGMVSCWVGAANSGVATASSWNDGKWHRFVFSMGAATDKVFVDGKDNSSIFGAIGQPDYGSSTPVYIGARGGLYVYTGLAADVAVYSSALSLASSRALINELNRGNPERYRWLSSKAYSIPAAVGGATVDYRLVNGGLVNYSPLVNGGLVA